MIIDDRSIAKPPYSGPNDTPLPDRQLTEAEILAVLEPKKVTKKEQIVEVLRKARGV